MRKLIIVAASFAALAVPTAALAAAPNGSINYKDNGGAQGDNASLVGTYASRITQNGQFVSGQDNVLGMDQTTYPGSRAELVQGYLGH
jgi:hypothetical protein